MSTKLLKRVEPKTIIPEKQETEALVTAEFGTLTKELADRIHAQTGYSRAADVYRDTNADFEYKADQQDREHAWACKVALALEKIGCQPFDPVSVEKYMRKKVGQGFRPSFALPYLGFYSGVVAACVGVIWLLAGSLVWGLELPAAHWLIFHSDVALVLAIVSPIGLVAALFLSVELPRYNFADMTRRQNISGRIWMFDWVRNYNRQIPTAVLERIDALCQECPDIGDKLGVAHLEAVKSPMRIPDPFLYISVPLNGKQRRVYIDVWDEDKFTADRLC